MVKDQDEKKQGGEKRRRSLSESSTVKKPNYNEEERRNDRESDDDDEAKSTASNTKSDIKSNSDYGSESPDEVTNETSKLVNDINARYRTVFLDNLPLETRKRLLRGIFYPCGPIEEVRLNKVKKYYGKNVENEMKDELIKVASITFSTSSGAEKAVDLNPIWINNNYVNVQYYDDTYIDIETFMSNRIFLLNAPHGTYKKLLV